MDGFAVRHADLVADGGNRGLHIVGDCFAGSVSSLRLGTGECVRITTGAPLPEGADTVVMKEHVDCGDGQVRLRIDPEPGQHVRRRGEDCMPGEQLLGAGLPMTPPRAALAAAQGLAEIDVVRRPTVAVFTTGDELVEPGMPLAHGQIYNSNRHLLMGLLRAEGLDPVAWPTLPDDPAQVESALRHAGHAFDIVLTCGAVSAGEKDHIPALLQAHGRVRFWKVQMKPGMPVLLAEGGGLGEALFLCLPGNPVSVLATWLAMGRRLVDGLQGRAEARPLLRARLAEGWSKQQERREFVRGRVESREDGCLWVQPNPAVGSHRMRAAAESNALITLAEGALELAPGSVVEILTY
jgi:molybdopterin molybdotransferase